MKKTLVIAIMMAVLLLSASCATRMPYAEAGLIGPLAEKDYEILGPVGIEGRNHNILGFIGWGGIGYNDLLDAARELYPETDAVINITEDFTSFAVAIIYNSFGFEISGLAIRYLDDPVELDLNVNIDEGNPAADEGSVF